MAARAQNLQRDVIAIATHSQIDAGRSESQISQHDLIEEGRQARIAQPDLAMRGVEFQTERGFEQRERRRTRPGLRRACHRIERWSTTLLAPKTAKQLR